MMSIATRKISVVVIFEKSFLIHFNPDANVSIGRSCPAAKC